MNYQKIYDSLSAAAKEVSEVVISALGLTLDNIKYSKSNRIIILSDIPRKEVFKKLEELGYEKDVHIKRSSAGGYRTLNGVEIITKSKSLREAGGHGVENENILVNKINYCVSSSSNKKTTIIIESEFKKLDHQSVIKAENVGRSGKKGDKADVLIHTLQGKIPISVKKDGKFWWESSMTKYKALYNNFIEKAYNYQIPNLSLIPNPENPKVLQMINTKTSTPYGKVYVTDIPGFDDQLEDFAFGIDKATVIQRSFSDQDFHYNESDNTLIVKVSNIISSPEDIKDQFKPVLQFERNASRAYKSSGYKGRGISLRIGLKESMFKSSRANNLILKYSDIV